MIRQEALKRAAALFAEKGFASTSLQDIADAVGLSRPALYYYFKNKDDVLTALVEDATTYPVAIMEKHRRDKTLSPAERLRLTMRELVVWIIKSPLIIRVLESNESKLPSQASEEHLKAKRRVLKAFVEMITDGINSGDFSHLDPRVAAFALTGMANWTAWWYNPEGERTPEEVAADLADMAVRALQKESKRSPAEDDLDGVLSSLKADIAQLERIVEFKRNQKTS